MNFSNIFIAISSILIVGAAVPYIMDIIKGKTKPRVVTWAIWGLLSAISCVASLAEHQYPTAILLSAIITGNIFIVILGWKHGDRKFNKTDVICLIGALVGIFLWWAFNSPAIAVIATIVIDIIGAVPTLEHSWKKPHEETLAIYLMQLLGDIFTLLSLSTWRVTSFAYPVYAGLINLVFSLIIIIKRKIK